MERVTLLIEESGVPLSCLLNPETVVVRRLAGVRPRASLGGPLTGAALADSPLLFTGGGVTELQLDLLFDVTLPGLPPATENVRELTGRFFALAENLQDRTGEGRPPLVRFIWGKSWNFPGIVAAVAERLEFFTISGEPRRSWMRMRLLRVTDEAPRPPTAPPEILAIDPDSFPRDVELPPDQVRVHEVVGGAPLESGEAGPGERLDALAHRYYGNPALWRLLAVFNGLTDPLHLRPGQLLRIPPLHLLTRLP